MLGNRQANHMCTCAPAWRPQVTLEPRDVAISASSSAPADFKGDLLVLGVCEEAFETTGEREGVGGREELLGAPRGPPRSCTA